MNANTSLNGSDNGVAVVNAGVEVVGYPVARRRGSRLLRFLGQCIALVAVLALIGQLFAQAAMAQSDIASSLTTLNTYWTDAVAIGVLVLLWVVGRMLVHKGTRG